MTKLLLYRGDADWNGVCQDSCENIGKRFKEIDSTIVVITVTAIELIEHIKVNRSKKLAWEKRRILAFPGGVASIWDAQLCKQVPLVKDFVKRGGNVFLVCAGAYFACRFSEFKVNSNVTFNRSRELDLFPGKAYGPLDPKTLNISEQGRLGAAIAIIDQKTKETAFMYFHGGGYFEPADDAKEGKDYKINHKYLDGKIASVSVKVDDGGLAIMTFFHPEYPTMPKISNEDISQESVEKTRKALETSNSYRINFFRDCLKEYGCFDGAEDSAFT